MLEVKFVLVIYCFPNYRNSKTRTMFLLKDAQHVLGCQWISGNMVCYVSPGYRFNYAVSRNVILEIPRASVEQIGTYTCVLDNNPERKSCDFRLTLCETHVYIDISLHK